MAATIVVAIKLGDMPADQAAQKHAFAAGQGREACMSLAVLMAAIASKTHRARVNVRVENVTSGDRASATVTIGSLPTADEVIVIAGRTLTWKASASGENEVTIGASVTAAATNLAAAVNAHSELSALVSATSAAGVVTVAAVEAGLGGTVPISREGKAATGTVTLTGLPVANETVTVQGVALTWKAAAANQNEVTIGGSSTVAATNLAAAINAHTSLIGVVTATSAAGVVTVTATPRGTLGNAVTLAEASSNLTVSGATLSGGTTGSAVAVSSTRLTGVTSAITAANRDHSMGIT